MRRSFVLPSLHDNPRFLEELSEIIRRRDGRYGNEREDTTEIQALGNPGPSENRSGYPMLRRRYPSEIVREHNSTDNPRFLEELSDLASLIRRCDGRYGNEREDTTEILALGNPGPSENRRGYPTLVRRYPSEIVREHNSTECYPDIECQNPVIDSPLVEEPNRCNRCDLPESVRGEMADLFKTRCRCPPQEEFSWFSGCHFHFNYPEYPFESEDTISEKMEEYLPVVQKEEEEEYLPVVRSEAATGGNASEEDVEQIESAMSNLAIVVGPEQYAENPDVRRSAEVSSDVAGDEPRETSPVISRTLPEEAPEIKEDVEGGSEIDDEQ